MATSKKTGSVRVVVTSPGRDLKETVSTLRRQGMKVESVLDSIGIVTGEIPEWKIAALQKTPGLTVEREQQVQLPPPDADIQ